MRHLIESDFGVSCISNNEDGALFAAFRKGGTERIDTNNGLWETHIVGSWHFVEHTRTDNTSLIQYFQIRQCHIPRFSMAEAADILLIGGGELAENGQRLIKVSKNLGLRITSEGKWAISIPNNPLAILPESLSCKLEDDIKLLQKARTKVKQSFKSYNFQSIKTPSGIGVFHSSSRLIEAISFEKAMLPRLKPQNFGVFSAYCTFRDFNTASEMPLSLIRDLIATQWSFNPNDLEAGMMNIFLETQNRFLPKPIWGPSINIKEGEASRILAIGMQNLPVEKRVQFLLMNGMHGSGLFLPLAALTSCIDFEDYADILTRGFQPDSGEEQNLRKEAAYIKLYGELAVVT